MHSQVLESITSRIMANMELCLMDLVVLILKIWLKCNYSNNRNNNFKLNSNLEGNSIRMSHSNKFLIQQQQLMVKVIWMKVIIIKIIIKILFLIRIHNIRMSKMNGMVE